MTTDLLGILIDFFHPFYRLGGSWWSGSDVLAIGIGRHLHHRLLKVLIKSALLLFVLFVLCVLILCGLSLCLVVLLTVQAMSSFLISVSYPRHSLFNLQCQKTFLFTDNECLYNLQCRTSPGARLAEFRPRRQ